MAGADDTGPQWRPVAVAELPWEACAAVVPPRAGTGARIAEWSPAVVDAELGPDLIGWDRWGLLGQRATGRDHVGGVLEGLQVLRGIDRDHGGNRRSVAGQVDHLAAGGFADRVGRHGLIGRQLIGVCGVAHVPSVALPSREGEDLHDVCCRSVTGWRRWRRDGRSAPGRGPRPPGPWLGRRREPAVGPGWGWGCG